MQDRSRRAGRESRPVEDDSRRANERSRRVEDSGEKANRAAEEKVEDSASEANERSEPVEDAGGQAGRDARPTEDSDAAKADPAADEVKDDAQQANPESEPVEDADVEKANPAAREGAGDPEPNRRGARRRPVAAEDEGSQAPDRADRPGRRERRQADRDREPAEPMREEPAEPVVPDEQRQAEEEVKRATDEVEARIQLRKLDIEDPDEAQSLIEDILGAESQVSRAEMARDRRAGSRRAARPQGRDVDRRANPEQRREAAEFLRQRLRGQADAREAPDFFRRPEFENRRPDRGRDGRARRDPAIAESPRFFHEGRRYVHFDSRASIPAILLATAALDRVRVQPARDVRPIFFDDRPERRVVETALPPERYRGDDAWVVSYPVDSQSMISSNDILFRQGSTQFADGHSYDMVLALSDAMKDPALANSRFVIEGHASAEGSYENNMVLSQRRAEAIVREMVRGGISPDRLIPVGYGESEARYPADAAESLRSQDRRVMVFSMDERSAGR